MGPTWDPPGADRTEVGLMLAPWTLLSGYIMLVIYASLNLDSNSLHTEIYVTWVVLKSYWTSFNISICAIFVSNVSHLSFCPIYSDTYQRNVMSEAPEIAWTLKDAIILLFEIYVGETISLYSIAIMKTYLPLNNCLNFSKCNFIF